jgi:hypothetical protein
MTKFGLVTNMQTDEKSSLNIFEMFVKTNEPTKELMNKELYMFGRFQMDVKDIKCPLEWWGKHEYLFSIVAFLAHHVLGIVDFQTKTENFFSLIGILTNLRRCCLQLDNLDMLIFVLKNWPHDLKVGGL